MGDAWRPVLLQGAVLRTRCAAFRITIARK